MKKRWQRIIRISDRAYVIHLYHIELDRPQEECAKGDNKIELLLEELTCFIWIRLRVLNRIADLS